MKIYLLRHGQTTYNVEKRYQGTLDIPLSPEGKAQLVRADIFPKTVYVSPLIRARSTADILFPEAKQVIVEDLREMCFGIFQGRNYIEMEHDPEYIAWVGKNCEGCCPGGERKAEFSRRTCNAFAPLVEQSLKNGEEMLVVMAHGGSQMAIMERYALPHHDYYHWCGPNAGGYVLEASTETWNRNHTLVLVDTVQYVCKETKGKGGNSV